MRVSNWLPQTEKSGPLSDSCGMAGAAPFTNPFVCPAAGPRNSMIRERPGLDYFL